MSKWKEITDDCWERKAGELRIRVHRHMDYSPNDWLITARMELPSKVKLAPTDIAQAQCQATAKVQVALEEALRELLATSTGEGGE